MKRYLIMIAVAIGFAACESSDEQPNPFEGMPAEEIVQQEGGIDYLIEKSTPIDDYAVMSILESGSVLEITAIWYTIENGSWRREYLLGGSINSYVLKYGDENLRYCWHATLTEDYYIGTTRVYWMYDDEPIPQKELLATIVYGSFYNFSNVRGVAITDDILFVSALDAYGQDIGSLVYIQGNRQEILTTYCTNVEDCTKVPAE